MALGAMTVVAVSILTATTLLPALIAMLGDRVMPGGVVARVLSFFRRRALAGRTSRPTAERPLLAALDDQRHGPSLDRRDRGQRASALPRDPGALADHRHPGAQPVPQGQRRAGRRRTGLQAGRRRHRPGADRRSVRRPARPRRDRRLHPHGRSDARRQLGRAAGFRRRQRPDPGDAEGAERVRRGGGAGRSPARHGRALDRSWPASPRVKVGGETARSDDVRARSAARCGRSSSSSSPSASSS